MEYIYALPENEMVNDTFEDAMTRLASIQKESLKRINQEKIATVRHNLAEEAEKLAHGATIIVTATKFATGSQELEIPEAAIAATTLTLSFLHAAHHKYLLQQKEKHLVTTPVLA